MARFAFSSMFEPRSATRRFRALQEGPKDAGRHRRQTIKVPTGKTKLCILDDKALSATLDAKALRLMSSVEGVDWWPIDSATPSVSEDTRAFGWLLDLDAPTYDHVHTKQWDQAPVHNDTHLTGTSPGTLYSTLPCWQGCAEDRAHYPTPLSPSTAKDWTFYSTATDQLVNWRGKVIDLSCNDAAREVMFLIGKDNPYDLGVDGDGLEFHTVQYFDDATQWRKIPGTSGSRSNGPRFHSYPYSSTYPTLESIPALTPAGFVPFATNDPNIGKHEYDGGETIGWDIDHDLRRGQLFYRDAAAADVNPVTGWATYRFTKSFFAKRAGAARGFAGNPVWNRITGIEWGVELAAAADAGNHVAYLANIYFGPRPGRLRRLRPFEHCTDRPWAPASIPAIGLQNTTGLDAEVTVEYWGV